MKTFVLSSVGLAASSGTGAATTTFRSRAFLGDEAGPVAALEKTGGAVAVPPVCDLRAAQQAPQETSVDENADVQAVLEKNPLAMYLRTLGPQYQGLPARKNQKKLPLGGGWGPQGGDVLHGGKDDLPNDWAFNNLGAPPGECVHADAANAQKLAQEWSEYSREKPLRDAAEFRSPAMQNAVVQNAPTATFALELMRPSCGELEMRMKTSTSRVGSAWVFNGLSLYNVLSAMLFTNGQVAGTNYLARKGINMGLAGGEQHRGMTPTSDEAGLRAAITFAVPVSWFEPSCPSGKGSEFWNKPFDYAKLSGEMTQGQETKGVPGVVIVGEVVDVTGLGFRMSKIRRAWQQAAAEIKEFVACERAVDRINIRGVLVVPEDEKSSASSCGESDSEKEAAESETKSRVRAALLAAEKYTGKNYELALSTYGEFKQFLQSSRKGSGGQSSIETKSKFWKGAQKPIPAEDLMAWQKAYRVAREASNAP